MVYFPTISTYKMHQNIRSIKQNKSVREVSHTLCVCSQWLRTIQFWVLRVAFAMEVFSHHFAHEPSRVRLQNVNKLASG